MNMLLMYLIPFSLPPFTEEWATTYLQVIFESFIFALGVPAAIYNLIDSDIKHLAQTRNRARRYLLGTAVLYVVVFAVVWLIPPDPSPPPGVVSPQSLSSVIKSFLAVSTVTILPLGVLVMGLRLNRQFEREKVITRLGSILLKRFNANVTLDSIALKDLSYLGRHGRAGHEKELVLDVIAHLVEGVQREVKSGDMHYCGFELEVLIRQIPRILDNTTEPGNEENYHQAAEVLSHTWRWLNTKWVTDDSLSTQAAIKHLALRAVEKTTEEVSLTYLEIAADCDSNIVFDIGLAAFRVNKYMLAAAALTKLEGMANSIVANNEGYEALREIRANLLGLTAHFAASGASGSRRAETVLQFNLELLIPTPDGALADAADYQYQIGRYETADKLQLLITKAAKKTLIVTSHSTEESLESSTQIEARFPLSHKQTSSRADQSLLATISYQGGSYKHVPIDKDLGNPERFRIPDTAYAFHLLFFAIVGFFIFRTITTEEIIIALGTTTIAISGMWIMVLLMRVKSVLRVHKGYESSSR